MARVLFVCLQNAGRSQMCQAIFATMAPEHHQARSAGTRPALRVHPKVVRALREVGIDIGGREPQLLTDELARWADLVVTMGCGDQCPLIPGKRYLDWQLTDPSHLSLAQVRAVRDRIKDCVAELIADLERT